MIRAFFDDSGKESDPSNRVVCIAGYVALDMHLNLFNQGWQHLLMRHGISCVHMKDLMQDQGEYAALKWDWPKKKAVLEDFATVIKMFQLIGFGVAVDADSWREIPKEITRVQGDAQLFCFLRILRMVGNRMKISCPDDFAAICFDCDTNYTPARFQRFLGVREYDPDARKLFRSFAVADPKTHLPLQAADFLAWETRKELLRKMGGYESRPEFNVLFQTVPALPADYTGEFWNKDLIYEQLLSKAKP